MNLPSLYSNPHLLQPMPPQFAGNASTAQSSEGAPKIIKVEPDTAPKPKTNKKLPRPTTREFVAYFKHGANRDIVKALGWSYGPTVALSALVFVPFGAIFALLGIIPAWFAERHGQKLKSKLEESGRLETTRGPLARLAKLNNLWDKTEEPHTKGANIPHKMMDEFNRLLDELFPPQAKQKSADQIREWLKIGKGSQSFKWLNHAFNARQYYTQTALGKVFRSLRYWGGKIPLAPIQFLTRIPDYISMAATVMFRWDHISKIARHI